MWVGPALCGIVAVLYLVTSGGRPYGSFLAAKNRDAQVVDNNQPVPDCAPTLSGIG